MAYIGFSKLKSKLAGKPGIRNPGAVAASIGRKKYGAKKMSKMSSTHKTAPELGYAKVHRAASMAAKKGY